jgi:hypothetical protein
MDHQASAPDSTGAAIGQAWHVGPWLAGPLIPPQGQSVDPADQVTLDDSARIATLVVLERLTPTERTAFALRDVFQFSFDAVSSILGRSPVACWQLASRAPVAKTPLQFVMAGHINFAPMPINGEPGATALRNGLSKHIHAIANPYKLAHVASLLQPA